MSENSETWIWLAAALAASVIGAWNFVDSNAPFGEPKYLWPGALIIAGLWVVALASWYYERKGKVLVEDPPKTLDEPVEAAEESDAVVEKKEAATDLKEEARLS